MRCSVSSRTIPANNNMPVKHRIRHEASRQKTSSGGIISGKMPHRRHNAHRVTRKWPYIRTALLSFVCIAISIVAVATLGFGIYDKNMKIITLGLILVVAWFFMRLMCFFSGKYVTCPLCRASQLTSSKSNKHKKAYKIFPLSYATTAMMTAFFTACVRCMHCGVTFDLNKKHR